MPRRSAWTDLPLAVAPIVTVAVAPADGASDVCDPCEPSLLCEAILLWVEVVPELDDCLWLDADLDGTGEAPIMVAVVPGGMSKRTAYGNGLLQQEPTLCISVTQQNWPFGHFATGPAPAGNSIQGNGESALGNLIRRVPVVGQYSHRLRRLQSAAIRKRSTHCSGTVGYIGHSALEMFRDYQSRMFTQDPKEKIWWKAIAGPGPAFIIC